MALLPFDNQTAEPTLTQEVANSVRDALQNRLGLRPASESQADQDRTVSVTKRLVQITVSVAIMDQKQGKPLWERSGLMVEGEYDPGQEAQGRQRALDKLVTNIVEGAQSQW